MANPFFEFKQFKIYQDNCAMKVCTDACLFGALVADNIFAVSNSKKDLHCLDIGTGTGLLSLMTAQKNANIKIDAIEIDEKAAEQAKENIAASPWPGNIKVFNEDILSYRPGIRYDYIFSNPPFFQDDLRSADKAKNDAKHDTSLSLSDILQVVDSYLTPDGIFALILPYHRVDEFITGAKKVGFHLIKQVLVKQTTRHTFFRGILFFNRSHNEPVLTELSIKDADQHYTPQFIASLKDYYLYL